MMPCIPAPDRDRLDVGFPDFIASGEAAQVALHEGGAFAQDKSVVVFPHRLVPSKHQGFAQFASLPAAESF